MSDIHHPVGQFRQEFAAAHAEEVEELFERMARVAGVDERINSELVRTVDVLGAGAQRASAVGSAWGCARGLVIVAGVVCLFAAWFTQQWVWVLGSLACAILVVAVLNSRVRAADLRTGDARARLAEAESAAWQSMAQLNGMYGWGFVRGLLQKHMPSVRFDPYVSRGRLDDLKASFGWDDTFNSDLSVLAAMSGDLNGNPFIMGQFRRHWMGQETYHGSLQISWNEYEDTVGPDGRRERRLVTRRQTLSASVTKPVPCFGEHAAVIFGHPAAPDLEFSRVPSALSTSGSGLFSRWRRSAAIRSIERKGRRGHLTPMSNLEFDALFSAVDRTNEQQFRLLFTPLAQKEMLAILKDTEAGFGDDFTFTKIGGINIVEPAHLVEADFSSDPALFRTYDLAKARETFNSYHTAAFRSVYFALAPILAIPIYHEARRCKSPFEDPVTCLMGFWEHEVIANHIGDERLRSADCVTPCMMRSSVDGVGSGMERVRVTAHGYRSERRVDFVPVEGGDGRVHAVPVHWTEYLHTSKTTCMFMRAMPPSRAGPSSMRHESADWQQKMRARGIPDDHLLVRQAVLVAMLPGNFTPPR